MRTLRALAACAGLWSMVAAHAATTAPTVNLGTVSTFATYTDTDARSYNQAYDRQFTFTLANDASVRIDMREAGNTHWLDNYAAGLTNVQLTLLDANGLQIGTANVDPTYNGSMTSCLSGPKCRTDFTIGYTLTTALTAGTYTMELTGRSLGSGTGATLNIGALVLGGGNEAAYLGGGNEAAYLSAVTPVTYLPESGTWAMMGLGLLGVAAAARSRRAA